MPQLDRFLGAMAEYKAEALLLQQDQAPAFRFVSGVKSVSKSVLSAERLLALIEELGSGGTVQEFKESGSASFVYELSGREYSGVLTQDENGVVARIWDATEQMAAAGPTPMEAAAITRSVETSAFVDTVQEVAAAATLDQSEPAQLIEPTSPLRKTRIESGSIHLPTLDDHSEGDIIPDDLPPNYREHLDTLLRVMKERGASDLHLCVGQPPMYRIDGDIQFDKGDPIHADDLFRMILSITTKRHRDQFLQTKDTDCAYAIEGVSRYRCNYFFDRNGPAAAFRAVPSEIVSAKDLNLPPVVQDLARLNKGLVLVTGPTGSGKSTTLAAILDLVNQNRADHIITIEDPVEFVHKNKKCLINQREVGVHTGSFKAALRAALREDPDVVLVGELRDLETVEIAIETAETGHLVLATLHTTTAPSTVDRLIDQFPADQQAQIRVMLSESLRAVISQTLCKKKKGGRVAALEILLGIGSVSNLIREGKTFQIDSTMQTGKKHGMQTLNDHLMELVSKGVVDPVEAYLKAVDKHGLRESFERKGIVLKH